MITQLFTRDQYKKPSEYWHPGVGDDYPWGMERHGYPTDLTDAEWALLQPHLPPASPRGRPRVHSYRVILDAIFYLLRSGCAWRLLPNDLPPWQTVYHYFRLWRIDGSWEWLHEALCRRARVHLGRNPQ